MPEYDVFISYRREGGDTLSQLLYTRLSMDGYRVFYDVEVMGPGKFNEQILSAIENSAAVIAVLPPKGLDRCKNEGDWMRRELEYAITKEKLVIPVMMKGFAWPADLPEGLKELPYYQGIAAEFNGVFDTWYERLKSYIPGKPKAKNADGYGPEEDRDYEQGLIALEDGDYKRAEEIFNGMQQKNLRSALAWLGLVMAGEKVCRVEDLANASHPLEENKNFNRALRYADQELKKQLQDHAEAVGKRLEEEKKKRAAAEKDKAFEKKRKGMIMIRSALIFALIAAAGLFVAYYLVPMFHYNRGISLRNDQKWNEAVEELKLAGSYKDPSEEIAETRYLQACALQSEGRQSEAFAIFAAISGYKDADDLAARLVSAGPVFLFGRYPQTGGGMDSTPIEWAVMEYDAANRRVLLVSRYGLDVKPYNNECAGVTWKTCTLRTWLNVEFINRAFTEAERGMILTTAVDNSGSQCYMGWSTSGGTNTEDKVFLLSYAEANRYFGVRHYSVSGNGADAKSGLALTAYAGERRALTDSAYRMTDDDADSWWWLRSPGSAQDAAAFVNTVGSLHSAGVDNPSGCVRPALWISVESEAFRP